MPELSMDLTFWLLWWALLSTTVSFVDSQKPGFLSIACGASQPFTDIIGVEWVSGDLYTSQGLKSKVSASLYSLTDQSRKQVRYFPSNQTKFCLKVPVTAQAKYLVRATFYYGNYDGKNSPPTFVSLVDANVWVNVDLTSLKDSTYYRFNELVYSPPNDYLGFCVAGLPNGGVPIMSTLELRLLADNMYTNVQSNSLALYKLLRLNLGEDQGYSIRYPDDVYDRMWLSDSSSTWNPNNYSSISTSHSISSLLYAPDAPPSKVMQSARVATSSNLFYSFSLAVSAVHVHYYIALYLAELENLNASESRSFNLMWNNSLFKSPQYYGPVDLSKDYGQFRAVELYVNYTDEMAGPMNFTLTSTATSTKHPLLNALEIYLVWKDLGMTTSSNEAKALDDISSHFNFTNWVGDPCMPATYKWDEVTCNYNPSPSTIISLKLSSMQLIGSIPTSIAKLPSLVGIYLDNNLLNGEIPDLSTLVNLQYLHLQNNRLSGEIPSSIFNLPSLKELFLENNNLSGTLPTNTRNISIRAFGNPLLCLSTNATCIEQRLHGSSKTKIIIIVIVTIVVALLLVLVSALVLCRKNIKATNISESTPIYSQGSKSPIEYPHQARLFTLAEVTSATNNFSKMIGKGGFGDVYYGSLLNGQKVAVKRKSATSNQGENEFFNEVQFLTRLHHNNVLSLIGYCYEKNEQILIYEYMPGGTLHDRLHRASSKQHPLDLKTRLSITLGAAQGIEYLHKSCNPGIIHRDIKSNNILLTENNIAKVSDFGLSRLTPQSNATHVTTRVVGTPGYVDPEYWITNQLTEKSDVYSFGVVLLEIISGHEPREFNLRQWVQSHLEKCEIDNTIDPLICKNYNMESLWNIIELSLLCTSERGIDRPTMSEVVFELKKLVEGIEQLDANPSIIKISHIEGR